MRIVVRMTAQSKEWIQDASSPVKPRKRHTPMGLAEQIRRSIRHVNKEHNSDPACCGSASAGLPSLRALPNGASLHRSPLPGAVVEFRAVCSRRSSRPREKGGWIERRGLWKTSGSSTPGELIRSWRAAELPVLLYSAGRMHPHWNEGVQDWFCGGCSPLAFAFEPPKKRMKKNW